MIRTLLKPLSFLPALLLMYMIFSFSAQPAEVSSEVSYKVSYKIVQAADYVFDAGLEEWQIGEWANKIHFITRKLAHMTEYFALAVAVSFPLYVYGLHGILLMLAAGLICVGFACGDEYHQAFVAGRSPAAKDVCIDSVGVFFGILFVRIIGWTGRQTIFKPKEKVKKKKIKKKLIRKKRYEEELSDGARPYRPDGGYPGEPYRRDGGYPGGPYRRDDGYPNDSYRRDNGYPNDPYRRDGGYPYDSYRRDDGYPDDPYRRTGDYPPVPPRRDDGFSNPPRRQDEYREIPYRRDSGYPEDSSDRDFRYREAAPGREEAYRPDPSCREEDWFDEEDIDIDSAPDPHYDSSYQDLSRADDWGMEHSAPQRPPLPPKQPAPRKEPPKRRPETPPQPVKKKKVKKEKDWFFDM